MTYPASKTVFYSTGSEACPKPRYQKGMGDRHMYYVLQVAPGEEDKTEAHIKVILPEGLYGECFHLTRHMRKKFHGKWVDVREKLLPGYVFITAENAKELFLELKRVPMLTNIVGRDEWNFLEMPAGDVEWLEKIREWGMQDADVPWHEVGLSQVSVEEGNHIRIISGPLKGIEGMVKKIYLHKRMAEVEVPFMNRKIVICVGIELFEKDSTNIYYPREMNSLFGKIF